MLGKYENLGRGADNWKQLPIMNKLLTAFFRFSIMGDKSITEILERMCSLENNHQNYGL